MSDERGFAKRLTDFLTSVTGVITSLVALFGAVGALLVAVRGGGDDPADNTAALSTESNRTTAPPPATGVERPPTTLVEGVTIQEWRSDANEICRDNARELRAIGQPQTREEQALWFELAVPIGTRTLTRLRALDTPAGQQADVEGMLNALEEWRDFSQEVVSAWYAGDAVHYRRAIASAYNANLNYVNASSGLGAVDCVANPYE